MAGKINNLTEKYCPIKIRTFWLTKKILVVDTLYKLFIAKLEKYISMGFKPENVLPTTHNEGGHLFSNSLESLRMSLD